MKIAILKRLASLWELLATKSQLSPFVAPRDIEVFKRRVEGEGIAFLTMTLPLLFKALDSALAASTLTAVRGFKSKKANVYPSFLERAWETIFYQDGSLRPFSEDQVGAVACIRQLSAVFYKLKLPYTESQLAATTQSFLEAESEVANFDLASSASSRVLKKARQLVDRLLTGTDPRDIRPRHGSGSSACGVAPWERYESFRFIPRLNEEFPYDEYFFYNLTHLCDNMDTLTDAEEAEPSARVVFVPKDSRGPRLISCEPRELMYIQQGLMAKLYNLVERYPAVGRQISFTDQTVNRELARRGSLDSSLATLDLKEASDRVSLELVQTLFRPDWFRALDASRSRATMLPDGTVVPLAKFAPMGSACCFPVEAICFWSLCLATLIPDDAFDLYVRRLFRDELFDTDVCMSVFGDDIIVPTEHAQEVMTVLESCGLKVNKDKSYWSGPFRESCGGDYFNGHDVAPVRLKSLPDGNNTSRLRLAEFFNQVLGKPFARYLEESAHSLYESWYGPTPKSANFWTDTYENSVSSFNGLALRSRYREVPPTYRSRWNQRLHKREFRVPIESGIDINVNADRWGQVLRCELQQPLPFTSDVCTLAKRTRIKYGWTEL